MIRIDWNIFKKKFSTNAAEQFEFLAYCLFSYEFNIKYGIFRYKNHPGIETAPIDRQGQKIGFQAKFYSGKIINNKSDIVSSIHTAKRLHPDVNKIIFYLHQDFTCNSKGPILKPEYLESIEKTAKALDVTIEWRTHSHIEMMLSKPENKYLAEYFFLENVGIFRFLDTLIERTHSIFSLIHSSIYFSSQEIKINRSSVLELLKNNVENNIIVIYGAGGCGKTALLKDFYNEVEKRIPFFVLRVSEIVEFFSPEKMASGWNTSIQEFIDIHLNYKEKIFVIDSAEKILDLEDNDVIKYFICHLKKAGWTLLFTSRGGYLKELLSLLKYNCDIKNNVKTIEVAPISKENLYQWASLYKFKVPDNIRVTDLLCLPFYLNAYLQAYLSIEDVSDIKNLRNVLWLHFFSGTKSSNILSDTFCHLVRNKINNQTYYCFPDSQDKTDVEELVSLEILGYDTTVSAYYIVHDIYEEWALIRIVEQEFVKGSNETFFDRIGCRLLMRRAYRQWMGEQLFCNKEGISSFISYIINKYDDCWWNETLVAIIQSPYSLDFFDDYSEVLFSNNNFFLQKIAKLIVLTATKYTALIKNNDIISNEFQDYIITPVGDGWKAIIDFLYTNQQNERLEDFNPYLVLLYQWNTSIPVGKTTRQAASIAFNLFFNRNSEDFDNLWEDNRILLLKTITAGAAEIKDELSGVLSNYFISSKNDIQGPEYQLCCDILNHPLMHMNFIENLPEDTIRMASFMWMKNEKFSHQELEGYGEHDCWGITQNFQYSFCPASAYQTPIYFLLETDFDLTINFIVKIVNFTIDEYVKKNPKSLTIVKLKMPSGQEVCQYASAGLWNTYRDMGISSMPNLLVSIHMALEKILLEKYSILEKKSFEQLLIKILSESKSVSLSSVVASVVLKYPDYLFNVSKIFFTSREMISWDFQRAFYENTNVKKTLNEILVPKEKLDIYTMERQKTFEEDFRKISLETLLAYYQMPHNCIDKQEYLKRKKIIEDILDTYYKKYDLLSDYDKFFLARVDLRKTKVSLVLDQNNRTICSFVPELSPELQEINRQNTEEFEILDTGLGLYRWAYYKLRKEDIPKELQKYDREPLMAISCFFKTLRENKNNIDTFDIGKQIYLYSVLIIFYRGLLSGEEFRICKERVMGHACKFLEPDYFWQVSDGVDVALRALLYLYPISDRKEDIFLCLLLATFSDEGFGENIIRSIREYSRIDSLFVKKFFRLYLKAHDLYEKTVSTPPRRMYKKNNLSWNSFIENIKKEIKTVIENLNCKEKIIVDDYSEKTLCIAMAFIHEEFVDEVYFQFIKDVLSRVIQYLYYNDGSREKRIYQGDNFFEKLLFDSSLAAILLGLKKNQINVIVKILSDNSLFISDSDFLSFVIHEEDRKGKYDNFWILWNGFYPCVKEICTARHGNKYKNKCGMLKFFLLASSFFDEIKNKENFIRQGDFNFFERIVRELGNQEEAFYYMIKFLLGIGAIFQVRGILWLRDIIRENPEIKSFEMEKDIQVCLVKFVRVVFLKKLDFVKKNIEYSHAFLEILNYLVLHDSRDGYYLRELFL